MGYLIVQNAHILYLESEKNRGLWLHIMNEIGTSQGWILKERGDKLVSCTIALTPLMMDPSIVRTFVSSVRNHHMTYRFKN